MNSQPPPGLPPLPPVPDGYDRWEYRGAGWTSDGDHLFCFAFPGNVECYTSRLTPPLGNQLAHYFEALKSEHPAARVTANSPFLKRAAELEDGLRTPIGEHGDAVIQFDPPGAGKRITSEQLKGKLADMLAKAPVLPFTDTQRLEWLMEKGFISRINRRGHWVFNNRGEIDDAMREEEGS